MMATTTQTTTQWVTEDSGRYNLTLGSHFGCSLLVSVRLVTIGMVIVWTIDGPGVACADEWIDI